MKDFLKRIIIADIAILLGQAVALLTLLYFQHSDVNIFNVIVYFIFVMDDKNILFLTFPFVIFFHYLYLSMKSKSKNLCTFLIAALNFILIYFLCWIEMLLLIANDN